jgi:hypothetical protein
MNFLEKDLEEIIYTSGRDVLEERGLTIDGKLLRQVKIGNYGIADLIEFVRPSYDGPDREILCPGRITIYELKKEQIGISAFLQSLNYLQGITKFLQKKEIDGHYIIDIVLIGKNLDTSGSFCFITDLLSINSSFVDKYNIYGQNGTISYYTYTYNINGLNFHLRNGYDLNNNGF